MFIEEWSSSSTELLYAAREMIRDDRICLHLKYQDLLFIEF